VAKMSNPSNNSIKQKVFTIIVTYNGMQWIEECIDSVYETSTVIVVDNLSTDNTVNFIKNRYQDVKILEQNENLGFGKANNVGISYALNNGAEYALLLNQDAKMGKDSTEHLFNFAKSNTDYGILSPIHCDWSGNYLESSFSRYVDYKSNKDFYSDFVLNKAQKPVYNVPFIAAACWFLPKKVFETIGGFDPIFFHLGEDVNYTQRVIYHGFKIGVLPEIKVFHDTLDRVYPHLKTYSEKYFYKLNYRNKMKYANINLDNWEMKLNYNKRQLFKEILASLITLKFNNLKGAFKEYKEFESIYKESAKSRAINKEQGRHYLNF
jgi:GT2 family glycosyltransferase